MSVSVNPLNFIRRLIFYLFIFFAHPIFKPVVQSPKNGNEVVRYWEV